MITMHPLEPPKHVTRSSSRRCDVDATPPEQSSIKKFGKLKRPNPRAWYYQIAGVGVSEGKGGIKITWVLAKEGCSGGNDAGEGKTKRLRRVAAEAQLWRRKQIHAARPW